jgi:pimeloyl-ACP methyl ester carboxylesterase
MAAGIETRVVRLSTPRGLASLSYQVTGAGTPLLLVHGLAGSCRWWAKNVPDLSRSFRVYAIDLIGFGRSRARRTAPRFVLDEAAAILLAFMDRMDIERASIVGHSMGGHIAVMLAAEAPERVARLVLVDAAVLPIGRGRPGHLVGLSTAFLRFPIGFLPVLILDTLRAGPATIWRAARELLASDIRDTLRRIDAPTLIIWGERDTIVPHRLGYELAASLPGATLLVIPGAGHNPMWERPKPFNRAVLDFLAPEILESVSEADRRGSTVATPSRAGQRIR